MEKYKRLEDRLVEYWNSLTDGDTLPHESEIDNTKIADIWDNCFLALITENRGYKYEYLGENLIEAYGEDAASGIEGLISTASHRTVEKFDEAMSRKEPVKDNGEFTNSNQMLIKYRQILLPFVNEEEKVTYILGGMKWKSF